MKNLLRFLIVLVVLASLGAVPAATRAQDKITLEVWTFVNTHARWYREMGEKFTKENPNIEIKVTEIAYPEMHDRLLVALQSGGVGAPDIADIEQGRFGDFLRGGDPGLIDLKPRLEEGKYLDKLVAAREALYSYQGKIYGIEHALTPVVYYYRADLWDKAGVDPNKLETWDQFLEAAKKVATKDSFVMPVFNGLHEMLLRQRGADYFNEKGEVTIDSDISVSTMDWILKQVDAGIFAQAAQDNYSAPDWAAYKEGRFSGTIGADWYAGFFKDNVPDLSGKWKAAPLPAWEKGGSRTSVNGGTGSCIVATSKHVEEAWKFQQSSMLSVEGNVRRFELTTLFPPLIPAMTDSRLHAKDKYFSDQDLGAVFASVADKTPTQYQSPFRAKLNSLLAAAFQDMVDRKKTPKQTYTEIADAIRAEMKAG
jgi:arabinosaccharide transport system substrate-binding protein